MQCLDYSLLVGICDATPQEVSKCLTPNHGVSAKVERFQQKAADKKDGGPVNMILPKRQAGHLWRKVREEVLQIGPHGPHEGGGRIYFIGVIDFLITWSCRKKAEY